MKIEVVSNKQDLSQELILPDMGTYLVARGDLWVTDLKDIPLNEFQLETIFSISVGRICRAANLAVLQIPFPQQNAVIQFSCNSLRTLSLFFHYVLNNLATRESILVTPDTTADTTAIPLIPYGKTADVLASYPQEVDV